MRSKFSRSAGFTMIELLAVIVIIGIISAIAAPGWLSFVTRQRLNTARGEVLQVLAKAQSDAEQRSLSRTVAFDPPTGPPALSVYPTTGSPGPKQKIGDGKGKIKIEAFTNNSTANGIVTLASANSLIFDHKGQVVSPAPVPPATAIQAVPFVVKVTAVGSGIPSRCVIVTTLLGNMVTAEGNTCDTATGYNP